MLLSHEMYTNMSLCLISDQILQKSYETTQPMGFEH